MSLAEKRETNQTTDLLIANSWGARIDMARGHVWASARREVPATQLIPLELTNLLGCRPLEDHVCPDSKPRTDRWPSKTSTLRVSVVEALFNLPVGRVSNPSVSSKNEWDQRVENPFDERLTHSSGDHRTRISLTRITCGNENVVRTIRNAATLRSSSEADHG